MILPILLSWDEDGGVFKVMRMRFSEFQNSNVAMWGIYVRRSGSVYAHTNAVDGNKNVSEVLDESGNIVAHYEYAAFGDAVMVSGEKALANPFRFSSEYADDALGLTYYNYRHLDHAAGRWLSRDPIEEQGGWNLYGMVENSVLSQFDILGLACNCKCGTCQILFADQASTNNVRISEFKIVSAAGRSIKFSLRNLFEPKFKDEFIKKIIGKELYDIYVFFNEYKTIIENLCTQIVSVGRSWQPQIKTRRLVRFAYRRCVSDSKSSNTCIWSTWKSRTRLYESGFNAPEAAVLQDEQAGRGYTADVFNWIALDSYTNGKDFMDKSQELIKSAFEVSFDKLLNYQLIDKMKSEFNCKEVDEL